MYRTLENFRETVRSISPKAPSRGNTWKKINKSNLTTTLTKSSNHGDLRSWHVDLRILSCGRWLSVSLLLSSARLSSFSSIPVLASSLGKSASGTRLVIFNPGAVSDSNLSPVFWITLKRLGQKLLDNLFVDEHNGCFMFLVSQRRMFSS